MKNEKPQLKNRGAGELFKEFKQVGDWFTVELDDGAKGVCRIRRAAAYRGYKVSIKQTIRGDNEYLVELKEIISES